MKDLKFEIQLKKIHWLQSYGDEDELDLCAHGKVLITIDDEIVADNSDDEDDWWSLTAMALHLLRTLELNHTQENPVGGCLVPSEGHHMVYLNDGSMLHIETVYPIERGRNWWVYHEDDIVKLELETSKLVKLNFEDYKYQVLQFVDKVELFYTDSKPKLLPENEDDKIAYLKLWEEWKSRRQKWV